MAADTVHLITLDPGHFHASLVQKAMYPQVNPVVHVYAPAGPDLDEHLKKIEIFNTRADQPTHWQERVYTRPDFLDRMLRDRAGNVVVLAGNNARKTDYIYRSVEAGFNVLADKPMAVTPAGFDLLRKAFEQAAAKKVLLYDIMTERFETTSILQRELAKMPELFGTLEKGTPENPAVSMGSTHYFYKEVAGKPLIRPPWFYDVRQQGEAIEDVGTHLVDLVQWECFPGQALDWQKDIKVLSAQRFPTKVTLEQFKRSTGLDHFPGYLEGDLADDGSLKVFANGQVRYSLRGVYVDVTAGWCFEGDTGGRDTHYSSLRGTRAGLNIYQWPTLGYVPTLVVHNRAGDSAAKFKKRLRAAVHKLCGTWPGLDIKPYGTSRWQLVIPEKYSVGHEAHFAQVTENYLRYLVEGKLPSWEVPNMLAKYYTTTEAYRLSRLPETSR